jgi:predicted Zn-dependent protease
MRQIRRDPMWLDDAGLVDDLNRFAAPLTATPAAGSTRLGFFAPAEPSIDAFALPGGYTVVGAGVARRKFA